MERGERLSYSRRRGEVIGVEGAHNFNQRGKKGGLEMAEDGGK